MAERGPTRLAPPAGLLAMLTLTSTLATANDARHERLRIQSLLLAKHQCDLVIVGYEERHAASFARWRKHHEARISTIEASPEFHDQKRMAAAYALRMSERARSGLEKDCVRIGQTLKLVR